MSIPKIGITLCLICGNPLVLPQKKYCSRRCGDLGRGRGRSTLLHGHTKRGDAHIETRNKGGCYDCTELIGTILNVRTSQIVAICMEFQMSRAPPVKDGCDRPTEMLRGLSDENKKVDAEVVFRECLSCRHRFFEVKTGPLICLDCREEKEQ